MIHSFRVINNVGESIDLDIRRPEDTGFLVTSVIGLTFPNADISVAEYAAFDGAIFGNNRIPQRNIVMQLIFYPENREKLSIEQIRKKCDRYFPIKQQIKFYVTNDSGTYWIIGYIESNDVNIFSNQEGANISILCDDPYFVRENSDSSFIISKIDANFSFPCSFEFEIDGYRAFKYVLSLTDNDDGIMSTITGVDHNYQPVDVYIEDMDTVENVAGGLELVIPPEDIYMPT